jgi:transcriptional regulator with XRE-family HTH domain
MRNTSKIPPTWRLGERKGSAMSAGAQDSAFVDEDAGRSQESSDSQAARGAAIRAERDAAFLTQEDVAADTGLSRQTIGRAERGDPRTSESTYRTLENFFKNEISGPASPPAHGNGGLIEFELEGDFGVRAVVRGPIGDAEAVERAAARFVERIRAHRATDESSEGEREPK